MISRFRFSKFTAILLWPALSGFFFGCKDKVAKQETDPKPVANFTFNVFEKGRVGFNSTSKNAENVIWDYGDGVREQVVVNPDHIYKAPGSYTVKLTAQNTYGTNTISKEVVIPGQAPEAAFTYKLIAGGCVQFTNTSKNATSIKWEFEGATPSESSALSPSICFPFNGDYKVKLTAIGFGPNNVVEKVVNVTGGKEGPPKVDFSFKDLGNGKYEFTNLTNGDATFYEWSLEGLQGYKEISNVKDLTYQFKANNTNTIKLCVTGKGGTTCVEKRLVVTSVPFVTLRDKIMGLWVIDAKCTKGTALNYMLEFSPDKEAAYFKIDMEGTFGTEKNGWVVGDSLFYNITHNYNIGETGKGKISSDGKTITIESYLNTGPEPTRCVGDLKKY